MISLPTKEKMVGLNFSNGGRKCIRQILQAYQSGMEKSDS